MAAAEPVALLATHYSGLFKYFCRAVGDSEVARDLTQEVFVRVSRTTIPVFRNGQGAGWLFRIARNLALDHHRNRRRRPPLTELTDAGRSPSQDVGVGVSEALATLPDTDRDVFLLREVAGLSYEEIAAACELTPDAVRSRIHRARLALRDQLMAPISTFRAPATARAGNISSED